jgi:hypothetical protein
MVTHFRFVRDRQKHIKKVAVVTESHLADVAEHLGSTLCQPRSNIFPKVSSSKRDNGLLTARNLLSRNVSRGAY